MKSSPMIPSGLESKAYQAGFSAKAEEIAQLGFEAARDKFNSDYPVPYTGGKTPEATLYADGQWKALCTHLEHAC